MFIVQWLQFLYYLVLHLQLHVIGRLTFSDFSVVASSGTGLSVLSMVDSPSVAMDVDPSTSGREKDMNSCSLHMHENLVG